MFKLFTKSRLQHHPLFYAYSHNLENFINSLNYSGYEHKIIQNNDSEGIFLLATKLKVNYLFLISTEFNPKMIDKLTTLSIKNKAHSYHYNLTDNKVSRL